MNDSNEPSADVTSLSSRLKVLTTEHRDLDAIIHQIALAPPPGDDLLLRRLKKRKLLISSRDLLQSILTKYPQSGITDKVQRNLARIESDLRGLEGSSTPRPVSGGGAYVPPKTGGTSL